MTHKKDVFLHRPFCLTKTTWTQVTYKQTSEEDLKAAIALVYSTHIWQISVHIFIHNSAL